MPQFKEPKHLRKMSDNTELKILDELLKTLSNSNSVKWFEIMNETLDRCEFLKDVDHFTFQVALLKLVKDEYVIETNKDIDNPKKTHYNISFEGLFFIKKGGYDQALLEVQRKENAYADLVTEQRKQSASLVVLNRWVVFGAIVVAIDSTLNILRFFDVYFDTSNFLFCIKPT